MNQFILVIFQALTRFLIPISVVVGQGPLLYSMLQQVDSVLWELSISNQYFSHGQLVSLLPIVECHWLQAGLQILFVV